MVDPRSGEILDADIGVDAMNVRAVRNLRAETLPAAVGGASAMLAPADAAYCEYGDRAAAEAVFGLLLLGARGEPRWTARTSSASSRRTSRTW